MTSSTRDPATDSTRRRSKNYARAALAALVMMCAIAGIAIAGASISAVSDSSETAEIFNDAGLLPNELVDTVTWRADSNDSEADRQVEPLTRELVTASWLRAWEQLRILAETGDTSGVAVSFSNAALDNVLAGAGAWGTQSMRQIGHDLEVTFYSDDGQIIGLTSHATELLHTDQRADRMLERRTTEGFEAVLVLEDGSWRIHHLVRHSADLGPWIETATPG